MTRMAAHQVKCDGGCGAAIYGESTQETHATAEREGWTFPNKVLASGRPSTKVSDVCPKCTPTFEPVRARTSSMYEGMSKEERRIKTFLNMNWNFISPEERERMEGRLAEATAKRKQQEATS